MRRRVRDILGVRDGRLVGRHRWKGWESRERSRWRWRAGLTNVTPGTKKSNRMQKDNKHENQGAARRVAPPKRQRDSQMEERKTNIPKRISQTATPAPSFQCRIRRSRRLRNRHRGDLATNGATPRPRTRRVHHRDSRPLQRGAGVVQWRLDVPHSGSLNGEAASATTETRRSVGVGDGRSGACGAG